MGCSHEETLSGANLLQKKKHINVTKFTFPQSTREHVSTGQTSETERREGGRERGGGRDREGWEERERERESVCVREREREREREN